eukprot:5342834-Prymnesium_polylepis.1
MDSLSYSIRVSQRRPNGYAGELRRLNAHVDILAATRSSQSLCDAYILVTESTSYQPTFLTSFGSDVVRSNLSEMSSVA